MKLTYDKAVDALYIEARAKAKVARTMKVSETVRVDFDAEGRLVGIEILDATYHLGKPGVAKLPEVQAEEILLADAAKEADRSPETLRWAIHAGKLRARKRGRDWVVTAVDVMNYLEAVESGREPKVPSADAKAPRRRKRVVAPGR